MRSRCKELESHGLGWKNSGLVCTDSQPLGMLWGWMAKDDFEDAATPREYLANLATAAEQWFDREPTSVETLAVRLKQWSQGCQRLIDGKHELLSETDRAWLVEKCRKLESQDRRPGQEVRRSGR